MGGEQVRGWKRCGGLVRSILILMSGAAVAQAIAFLASPALGRLYDPAAYGVYGAFGSVVAIVLSVATLRYDLAVVLPKKDDDAANVLGVAVAVVCCATIIAALACLFMSNWIAHVTGSPGLAGLVWLVPVDIFFAGLFVALNSWAIRRKSFRLTSQSRVTNAIFTSGTQIAAGVDGAGALGLVGGTVTGDAFGAVVLGAAVLKRDGAFVMRSLSLARMRALAREYADFPKCGAPQNLISNISTYLPVLMLAFFHGPRTAGLYAIGCRMLAYPASLLVNSYRPAITQRAAEIRNTGGDTYAFFRKATLSLTALLALPTLLILLFAPQIFGVVLGEKWTAAGSYARWIILWQAPLFANGPSMIFAQVYRRQRFVLIYDILMLISRGLALTLGGLFLSGLGTVAAVSLVGMAFNIFIIVWMHGFLKHKRLHT